MPVLPPSIATLLAPFASLFSRRVWAHAQVVLIGALLAPAQRTIAAALRATGRADTPQFHRYHRVLSHARCSGLAAGRVLLGWFRQESDVGWSAWSPSGTVGVLTVA